MGEVTFSPSLFDIVTIEAHLYSVIISTQIRFNYIKYI